MQWTEQQLEAITARGGNLLVAAAAGSGKTAVLVERIIRRVMDKEQPVRVDRLLVLTFTEAAAGEMKRKIADALEKARRAAPDDRWIAKQCMLVHSAQISTIHAFCKTMIQNHIHRTNLPADFSVIDETENEVLRRRALDAVMESYYRRIDRKTGFRELVLGYGGVKNDSRLRELILRLDQFVRSLAYPNRWLKESGAAYLMAEKNGSIAGTLWEKAFFRCYDEGIADIRQALEEICRMVEKEVPADHRYAVFFPALYRDFCAAFQERPKTIDGIRKQLETFVIPRVPVKKGLDDQIVDRIGALRKDVVKKGLDGLKSLFAGADDAGRIARCRPAMMALKQILRQTERLHTRFKRERSALDFGDMEHEALRLLGTAQKPSAVLRELREKYVEILVDEYQDTNHLQDTMFTLLSGDEGKLFMVGDLKQSIYGFRNADPSIFAEKYKAYAKGKGGRLIRLSQNFRSRAEVVDTVNSICRKIISSSCGDVAYTKEEYLVRGAEYPPSERCCTELLLTLDETREESPEEMEARRVAGKIRALMTERFCVTDKRTGNLRPLRYGDIAILMRKVKGAAEVFERIFREYGIPVYTDAGAEYLNTVEVKTVLCFLQIIDNPLQDIPLLAVMRSPMFGFTAEELAEIRTRAKGRYYTAVCRAAKDSQKAAGFLRVLKELRERSAYMGIDELIWYIISDLKYSAMVGAMPGGALRRANLKLLFEHGAAFENGTLHGVFDFMQYIENIKNNQGDLTPAKPYADGADVVRMMTVHKSKGLEFPVVFLCGTHGAMNFSDLRLPVLWHVDLGLAFDWQDGDSRRKYKTAVHTLAVRQKEKELRSEELRLLYVAMTRASEKLIFSCYYAPEKRGSGMWQKAAFDTEGRVYPFAVKQGKSFMDWLLSACLASPGAGELRRFAERKDVLPAEEDGLLVSFRAGAERSEGAAATQTQTEETLPEDLEERFAYHYPHKGSSQTPVKLSVSEMKRRQMPEGEYVPRLHGTAQALLTDVTEIGAAEKGTITHFCLQQMDPKRTACLEEIQEQLDGLLARGVLQKRQRLAVRDADLLAFFQSPLGKRMKAAQEVYREFDFYLTVPAREVLPAGEFSAEDGREEVLLQGIADCFFVEDGGIVLLDYKTDRITAAAAPAAAERYRMQLLYYAKGISAVMGLPVREVYVYFLACGCAVRIEGVR